MGRALRIGLYSPYFGSTLGGGERYLAVTAEAIRDGFPGHSIEIAGPVPADRRRYEEVLGVDLSDVQLVSTNRRVTPVHRLLNRIQPLRPLRNLVVSGQAGRFTERYDLLLAMVFRIPVVNRARRGVVLCQFPNRDPSPAELDGYQLVICQSDYVRSWVGKFWERDAWVIHPPVEVPVEEPDWRIKGNLILSVGRFFVSGHAKRQDLMVESFRRLCDSGLTGWQLHVAGSVHREGPHAGYFEKVAERAKGYPIYLHPDVHAGELRQLYSRASIYWHAAGYGADLEAEPESAEHFGMTTVEAMAHGAVPVVFSAGGQLEVVGQDRGALWRTPEELERETLELVAHPSRRAELGVAAREWSKRYSTADFKRAMQAALAPLVAELEASGLS